MSFAEAWTTIEKEGVETGAGGVNNITGGGDSEVVVGADNEIIERIFTIEAVAT